MPCKMYSLHVVLIQLTVIIPLSGGTLTEKDIITNLFTSDTQDAMPRTNTSEEIRITMDLTLLSIVEVNEKKRTFKVRAFLEVKWNNKFLTWEPHEYGGIHRISVPNYKIWQPDLALLDTYDSLTDLGQVDGKAIVDYTGNVTIWPYKLYTVGCAIKARKFPFDVQTCHLDFLSWTNPVSVLDLQTSRAELSRDRYQENEEWWLEHMQITYYLQPYGDDHWAHVKYTFTLRRKWLFYILNIIAPIMCISLLNITTFLLPASSGEKITLCISTFLTLAVFLTIITNSLPESSEESSILGWYVGLQLVGNGSSILCTVISLRFYTKDSNDQMSDLVKLLWKLGCKRRREKCITQSQRNGSCRRNSDQSMSAVGTNFTTEVEERDITWVSISCAFDRLCLWVAICWHVCLFTTLVVSYTQ